MPRNPRADQIGTGGRIKSESPGGCARNAQRSICEQTTTAGVSVVQVARRYSMNANLIFKWLKDPRFAPQVGDVPKLLEDGAATFLPIGRVASITGQARSTLTRENGQPTDTNGPQI